MRVRALVGAVVAFLATLMLLLCLSETRQVHGHQRWGIAWVSRWGNVWFEPFWYPLITMSFIAVPGGYILGDRLSGKRGLFAALAGAFLFTAFLALVPSAVAIPEGRARQNERCAFGLAGAILGGAIGVMAEKRLRRRKVKRDAREASKE